MNSMENSSLKIFIIVMFFLFSIVAVACAQPAPTPTRQQNSTSQPNIPTQQPATQAPQAMAPAVPAPAGIKATNNVGVEYLNPVPMVNVVKAKRAPVRTDKTVVPIITWGADEADIYANAGRLTQAGSIFSQEGLSIELSREDNVVKAIEKVISGETPYLRGTMDMVLSGIEALKAQGVEMEAVYLLSRSTGGDTLVVREGIEKIADLEGKTIGLQLYGPHMLFLATVLDTAGLTINDVQIRWLRELTLPPYETPMFDVRTGTRVAVDPATAFERDQSLDAVVIISPDMLVLTSGGNVGKGGDGSRKGARMLFSSKTLGNVIYDVYAVTKDYLQSHRAEVQAFVHGLLRGQEEQVALFNASQQRKQEYDTFLRLAAEILRDNPQATADIEGMYGDMTFAGYPLNVQFFTSKTDLRRFELVKKEAENALIAYGLLSGPVSLSATAWDYNVLAKGLRDTGGVVVPKFDTKKVEQFVESGTRSYVLEFSILFGANENKFPVEQYWMDFNRTIDWAVKYPGAIIVIEGNADVWKYRDMEKKGYSQQELSQIRQSAKNNSQSRADEVKKAIIAYAKSRGVDLNETQFTSRGVGIDKPVYANPVPESATQCSQCAANRRVVFQLIPLEAEADVFTVSGGK